eukprot:gene225-4471_t
MKLYMGISWMFIGMIFIDLAFDVPFLFNSFNSESTFAAFTYYKTVRHSFVPNFIIMPFMGFAFLLLIIEIISQKKLFSVLKLLILGGAAAYFEFKVTPPQVKISKMEFDPKSMEIVEMIKAIGVGHIILLGSLVMILLLTAITEKELQQKEKKN